MARAGNFTDIQKAQLYVRDRATCAYSGLKLWILDGGAVPGFDADWADHVSPSARGGESTLANGVCASWYHNRAKRANAAPAFLFYEGKPTKHFYDQYDRLPRKCARDLNRLGRLHYSDWYFNRALFRLLCGVGYLRRFVGVRKRDDAYYASATLKMIVKWRRIVNKAGIATLEERGLAPTKPSPDQKLMLSVRLVTNTAAIRLLMKKLLPIYVANAARRG